MLVGLYTSRVVLITLGIEDFGIYSIVGGIVALFGVFNGAMSSATQRYLAFDIGSQNFSSLKKTFNSALIIHIGIAFIILFFAETIGLWYVNHKLNVPVSRMVAINWVYQFSIFTSLIGVLQVPFNALIIAHERMNIFALISIVDVILKLIIVYLLLVINYDKLIIYSVLVFSIALLVAIIYRIYCFKHFSESKFEFFKDRDYYKELISYSSWNLFGNIAAVAKGQGVNIVLNIFFGTVVNAAYGIAMTVQGTVGMFVSNFQMAVNPQIIKNFSQNNRVEMQNLIFQSAKFSFFLMLTVCSPILFNSKYLLELWLKTVPAATIVFVQLCLVNIIIDCISGPLMTGIQATGKIRHYQAVVGALLFLNLPLSYLVLKITHTPLDVFIISILISLISLQFRLFYLQKVTNIQFKNFYKIVMCRLILISSIVIALYYCLRNFFNEASDFISFGLQSFVIILVVLAVILLIGINKKERHFLKKILIEKIRK